MRRTLLTRSTFVDASATIFAICICVSVSLSPFLGIKYMRFLSQRSLALMSTTMQLIQQTQKLHEEKKEIETLLYKVRGDWEGG